MVVPALPPWVRLPAGGRTLVGPTSALPGPACALASCLPRLGAGCPLATETLRGSCAAHVLLPPLVWMEVLALCGGRLLGLPASALLPLPSLVTIRCFNSQGGDPSTPELLRGALPRVRAAPNSQDRGPKHPDGHLVANQLGWRLVALLMQTARGGDLGSPPLAVWRHAHTGQSPS